MLSIRLSRRGTKKKPFYRIIVVEKARDPYGKYVENIGTYNPHTKEAVIKADRVKYWIGQGAQATPTVYNLLISQGITEGEKVRASKSQPGKKKRAAAAGKESAQGGSAKAEEVKSEEKESAQGGSTDSGEKPTEEKKDEAKPAEAEEKKE